MYSTYVFIHMFATHDLPYSSAQQAVCLEYSAGFRDLALWSMHAIQGQL